MSYSHPLKEDFEIQAVFLSKEPPADSTVYVMTKGVKDFAPKGQLKLSGGDIANIGDLGRFIGWETRRAHSHTAVPISLQKTGKYKASTPLTPMERVLSNAKIKLAKDKVRERDPFFEVVRELLQTNKK